MAVLVVFAFVSAIKECAFIVAADLTVGDSYVFCRSGKPKSKRALRTDAIVKRRVDTAIRNTNMAAAVQVDTVSVCIDLHIVDCEIVYTRRQNRKMTSVQN